VELQGAEQMKLTNRSAGSAAVKHEEGAAGRHFLEGEYELIKLRDKRRTSGSERGMSLGEVASTEGGGI